METLNSTELSANSVKVSLPFDTGVETENVEVQTSGKKTMDGGWKQAGIVTV